MEQNLESMAEVVSTLADGIEKGKEETRSIEEFVRESSRLAQQESARIWSEQSRDTQTLKDVVNTLQPTLEGFERRIMDELSAYRTNNLSLDQATAVINEAAGQLRTDLQASNDDLRRDLLAHGARLDRIEVELERSPPPVDEEDFAPSGEQAAPRGMPPYAPSAPVQFNFDVGALAQGIATGLSGPLSALSGTHKRRTQKEVGAPDKLVFLPSEGSLDRLRRWTEWTVKVRAKYQMLDPDHGEATFELALASATETNQKLARDTTFEEIWTPEVPYSVPQMWIIREYSLSVAEKLPPSILEACMARARVRTFHRSILLLEEVLYRALMVFCPANATTRLADLKTLKRKQDVPASGVTIWLQDWFAQFEQQVEKQSIRDSDDFTEFYQVVRHVVNPLEKLKLKLALWDDDNVIDPTRMDKEFFLKFYRMVKGLCARHYPLDPTKEKEAKATNQGPATASPKAKAKAAAKAASTPKKACTWCLYALGIKDPNKRKHSEGECRKKNGCPADKLEDLKKKYKAAQSAADKAKNPPSAHASTGAGAGGNGVPKPAGPRAPKKKPRANSAPAGARARYHGPCKYKVSRKQCPFGDGCNFSHDDALVKEYQDKECPMGKKCTWKDQKSGCGYGKHNKDGPSGNKPKGKGKGKGKGKKAHLSDAQDEEYECEWEETDAEDSAELAEADESDLPSAHLSNARKAPTSSWGSVDSCANILVAHRQDQCVPVTLSGRSKISMRTTAGRFELPLVRSRDCPLPATRGVLAKDAGGNLFPMCELPGLGVGFSWMPDFDGTPPPVVSGPALYQRSEGEWEVTPVEIVGGKPQLPSDYRLASDPGEEAAHAAYLENFDPFSYSSEAIPSVPRGKGCKKARGHSIGSPHPGNPGHQSFVTLCVRDDIPPPVRDIVNAILSRVPDALMRPLKCVKVVGWYNPYDDPILVELFDALRPHLSLFGQAAGSRIFHGAPTLQNPEYTELYGYSRSPSFCMPWLLYGLCGEYNACPRDHPEVGRACLNLLARCRAGCKAVVCDSFVTHGSCHRGNDCPLMHTTLVPTDSDVRAAPAPAWSVHSAPKHPLPCLQWYRTGWCPDGDRCRKAHPGCIFWSSPLPAYAPAVRFEGGTSFWVSSSGEISAACPLSRLSYDRNEELWTRLATDPNARVPRTSDLQFFNRGQTNYSFGRYCVWCNIFHLPSEFLAIEGGRLARNLSARSKEVILRIIQEERYGQFKKCHEAPEEELWGSDPFSRADRAEELRLFDPWIQRGTSAPPLGNRSTGIWFGACPASHALKLLREEHIPITLDTARFPQPQYWPSHSESAPPDAPFEPFIAAPCRGPSFPGTALPRSSAFVGSEIHSDDSSVEWGEYGGNTYAFERAIDEEQQIRSVREATHESGPEPWPKQPDRQKKKKREKKKHSDVPVHIADRHSLPPSLVACKGLVTTGFCRFADRCRFSHNQETIRAFERTECPAGTLCSYRHAARGGCAYGRHDVDPNRIPCKYLLNKQECPFSLRNSECAYLHDEALAEEWRKKDCLGIGWHNPRQVSKCPFGGVCSYYDKEGRRKLRPSDLWPGTVGNPHFIPPLRAGDDTDARYQELQRELERLHQVENNLAQQLEVVHARREELRSVQRHDVIGPIEAGPPPDSLPSVPRGKGSKKKRGHTLGSPHPGNPSEQDWTTAIGQLQCPRAIGQSAGEHAVRSIREDQLRGRDRSTILKRVKRYTQYVLDSGPDIRNKYGEAHLTDSEGEGEVSPSSWAAGQDTRWREELEGLKQGVHPKEPFLNPHGAYFSNDKLVGKPFFYPHDHRAPRLQNPRNDQKEDEFAAPDIHSARKVDKRKERADEHSVAIYPDTTPWERICLLKEWLVGYPSSRLPHYIEDYSTPFSSEELEALGVYRRGRRRPFTTNPQAYKTRSNRLTVFRAGHDDRTSVKEASYPIVLPCPPGCLPPEPHGFMVSCFEILFFRRELKSYFQSDAVLGWVHIDSGMKIGDLGFNPYRDESAKMWRIEGWCDFQTLEEIRTILLEITKSPWKLSWTSPQRDHRREPHWRYDLDGKERGVFFLPTDGQYDSDPVESHPSHRLMCDPRFGTFYTWRDGELILSVSTYRACVLWFDENHFQYFNPSLQKKDRCPPMQCGKDKNKEPIVFPFMLQGIMHYKVLDRKASEACTKWRTTSNWFPQIPPKNEEQLQRSSWGYPPDARQCDQYGWNHSVICARRREPLTVYGYYPDIRKAADKQVTASLKKFGERGIVTQEEFQFAPFQVKRQLVLCGLVPFNIQDPVFRRRMRLSPSDIEYIRELRAERKRVIDDPTDPRGEIPWDPALYCTPIVSVPEEWRPVVPSPQDSPRPKTPPPNPSAGAAERPPKAKNAPEVKAAPSVNKQEETFGPPSAGPDPFSAILQQTREFASSRGQSASAPILPPSTHGIGLISASTSGATSAPPASVGAVFGKATVASPSPFGRGSAIAPPTSSFGGGSSSNTTSLFGGGVPSSSGGTSLFGGGASFSAAPSIFGGGRFAGFPPTYAPYKGPVPQGVPVVSPAPAASISGGAPTGAAPTAFGVASLGSLLSGGGNSVPGGTLRADQASALRNQVPDPGCKVSPLHLVPFRTQVGHTKYDASIFPGFRSFQDIQVPVSWVPINPQIYESALRRIQKKYRVRLMWRHLRWICMAKKKLVEARRSVRRAQAIRALRANWNLKKEARAQADQRQLLQDLDSLAAVTVQRVFRGWQCRISRRLHRLREALKKRKMKASAEPRNLPRDPPPPGSGAVPSGALGGKTCNFGFYCAKNGGSLRKKKKNFPGGSESFGLVYGIKLFITLGIALLGLLWLLHPGEASLPGPGTEPSAHPLYEVLSGSADEAEAMHTRSYGGKCFRCGGLDHWAPECPRRLGGLGAFDKEVDPRGIAPFSSLPQRQREHFLKYLRKADFPGAPSVFWVSSSFCPEPPDPLSVSKRFVEVLTDINGHCVCIVDRSGQPYAYRRGHQGMQWILWWGDPIPLDQLPEPSGHLEAEVNPRGVDFDQVVQVFLSDYDQVPSEVKDRILSLLPVAKGEVVAGDPDHRPIPTPDGKDFEGIELIHRFVDDFIVAARKPGGVWSCLDFDWKEGQDNPRKKGGMKHVGVTTRMAAINKFQVAIVHAMTEFTVRICHEFFEHLQLKPRTKANPGPAAPRTYGESLKPTPPRPEEVQLDETLSASLVAHFLQSVSYLEAACRCDVSYELNYLQQRASPARWSVDCFQRLRHLFEYLLCTAHYGLWSLVDVRDLQTGQLYVRNATDSSFADAKLDRSVRSTNGAFIVVSGPHGTRAPSAWKCKLLNPTTISTLESEVSGQVLGMRLSLGVAGQMAGLLCWAHVGKDLPIVGECDNSAAVANINGGGIKPILRCCRRVFGYSISRLADIYRQGENKLCWRSGAGGTFEPDKFTKGLPVAEFVISRDAIGVCPVDIAGVFAFGNEAEPSGDKKKKKRVAFVKGTKEDGIRRKKAKSAIAKLRSEQCSQFYKDLQESFVDSLEKDKIVDVVHKISLHRCKGDVQCEACVLAKLPHASVRAIGENVQHVDRLIADMAGPFTPIGHDQVRYIHRIAFVLSPSVTARFSIPVRSKHSGRTKASFEQVEQVVRRKARSAKYDQGKEYLGEVLAWENERVFKSERSERFRPATNAQAESNVRVGLDDLRTIITSECPGKTALWPEVCGYINDVDFLRCGAETHVYGEESYKKRLRLLLPFGTLVFFHKETPENRAAPSKLKLKAAKGFYLGLGSSRDHAQIRVGYYQQGRLKHIETSSYEVSDPIRSYFDLQAAPEEEFECALSECITWALSSESSEEPSVPSEGAPFLARMSCCGKCRSFARDSEEADVAIDFESAGISLECRDLNLRCEANSDLQADAAYTFLVSAEEAFCEAFMTKTISMKEIKACGRTPFYRSPDMTWEGALQAAVLKELRKFVRFDVFGDVVEYAEAKHMFPDSTFVRLGLIFVLKNYESDPLLAARFVAFGNTQRDATGELSAGITAAEAGDLWTCPPSLAATRGFFIAAALLGHIIEGRDAEGAYLQEELGGAATWAELPPEAVAFGVQEGIFPPEMLKMQRPVVLLLKAVYGLLRSGHDFSRGADRKIESQNFVSLRYFDSEPSQYVRSPFPLPERPLQPA